MLTHSPPLPLTIDYFARDSIAAEDEKGILLALEQRHRVRHLRLRLPIQILPKLVVAIEEEFPILEYMIVQPLARESMVLVLPEILQAPHLRHLMLRGFACPLRPRLHPTAAGLVTLALIIDHQSAYFQPNVLLRWISFMPQIESLAILFTFPVPNRDVERQLTHTPITTHIALPNLHFLSFQGVSAYLEAVVSRITTPRLEHLEIQFFKQLTFSVPRLLQFMNTADNLRFGNAKIAFQNEEITVLMSSHGSDTYAFSVAVTCWYFDWQVSSVAQISNALSQVFSVVEDLTLGYEVHGQSSEEHNDVDRIEWRNLLTSFSNVKTLRIRDGLVEELSRCLQLEDGELPLELLPELQELEYFEGGDASDAFTSFIDARQNAGRPVMLVNHSLSPMPRPPPNSLFGSSCITLQSDDAGNDTET